ncbi:conserved hypothetical protein [Leishmania major strain Friedlin]|uniref:Uncharacterized protein n=1 Tax=Leishmania major TaxID=5664 RepID=Q4Q251_LEIMA|nr:conserved hypothetical protein [Leishmania major strain Friedlin]CAG9583541.1 hypothetical_protein_-_conserved [Leishmania major strain Friedlin]CAJ08978.1 conserved hypothetical protein [Leishmania major strain Friedlin]|eukprot:XP_001686597.1 conserved hypothetical protein [Leishmania major strain Friedlin]
MVHARQCDTMADIYAVAQNLIEELRTNLAELRRSPDVQARLQRTAARKIGAERARCHSHYPGFQSTAEKPRLCFLPLTTAPTTHVAFSHDFCRSEEAAIEPDGNGALTTVTATPCTRSCSRSTVTKATPSSGTSLLSGNTTGVALTTRPQILASQSVKAVKGQNSPAREPAGHVKHVAAAGEPRAGDGTTAANAASSEAHTDSATTAWCMPFSGVSRPLVDLRRLTPLARQLYTDMQRRAAAMPAASPSAEWRRRTAGPQDAEVRRAVRDYLYRMNIISVMEAEDTSVTAPHVFRDAVLNGTALCQLVATLREGGEPSLSDPVLCRCPRTLNEVRVNYAVALGALRSTPSTAQELMPRAAWTMTPEEVYLRASPTALLSLFVHLISTYLPAPEELPVWKQHMCWQPPADAADYAPVPPTELAAMEAGCCRFLHTWGVLPDGSVYQLPGDECLLPIATAAPYMAKWSRFVVRSVAPSSISVPSVWPFLCNGVLLVLLARRSGVEAAAKEAASSPALQPFFANPRTAACCVANITSALHSFQTASTKKLPLSLISEESVAAVIRGDRVHILHLLLHVRAAVEGTPQPPGVRSALLSKDAVAEAGCTPAKVSGRAPDGEGVAASSTSSWPSASLAQTPSTVAKAALRRSAPPSPAHRSLSPRRVPAIASSSSGILRREAVPADEPQGRRGLCRWLRQQLGTEYRYTAADESFVFDAATFSWRHPCLLFSDGVVLAYLIRRLERRRCSFLDCVHPTSKKSAKLFNVRRCLEFLRFNAGVVFDVLLLDEALTEGRVEGVVSVLQGMRRHYCLTNVRRSHHDA